MASHLRLWLTFALISSTASAPAAPRGDAALIQLLQTQQGRRLAAGRARDSHLPAGIADIAVFAAVGSGLHRLSVQLGLMPWN